MFTQDRENYFRTRMFVSHKLDMLENELIKMDELKSEYISKYKSNDYYWKMNDIASSINSLIETINEYSFTQYIDMAKYRSILYKHGLII